MRDDGGPKELRRRYEIERALPMAIEAAAGVAGQAAGDRKQSAAQGACGPALLDRLGASGRRVARGPAVRRALGSRIVAPRR